MEILTNYIIISNVLTSLIVLLLGTYIKSQFKKVECRNKQRVKETVIKMKSLQSIGQLTYATSIAVRDGKVNGELTHAIENYQSVKEELDAFILENHAEKCAENNKL